MRALDLDLLQLRLLNEALDGRIHPVLEQIVRAGAEPALIAVRTRVSSSCSSTWHLRVEGAGIEREFAVNPRNVVALGICAHCWLVDVTAELKRDLAAIIHGARTESFDTDRSWSTRPRRGVS